MQCRQAGLVRADHSGRYPGEGGRGYDLNYNMISVILGREGSRLAMAGKVWIVQSRTLEVLRVSPACRPTPALPRVPSPRRFN